MDLSINKNIIEVKTNIRKPPRSRIAAFACPQIYGTRRTRHTIGTSTIGSSEACMLGGMAAKWRSRARMKAMGKPTDKPNMVCGPVAECSA